MPERIPVTPRSLTAEPHPAVERLRDHGFEIVQSAPGAMPTEDEKQVAKMKYHLQELRSVGGI